MRREGILIPSLYLYLEHIKGYIYRGPQITFHGAMLLRRKGALIGAPYIRGPSH